MWLGVLFLVWFNNFARTTCFYWSYSSRPFLCALASSIATLHTTTQLPILLISFVVAASMKPFITAMGRWQWVWKRTWVEKHFRVDKMTLCVTLSAASNNTHPGFLNSWNKPQSQLGGYREHKVLPAWFVHLRLVRTLLCSFVLKKSYHCHWPIQLWAV